MKRPDVSIIEKYSNPSLASEHVQGQVYVQKKLHRLKSQPHPTFDDPKLQKAYVQETCPNTNPNPRHRLQSHQRLIPELINPDTAYPGLVLVHGTGTGKTAAAFAAAETFKPMIRHTHERVWVVVPNLKIKSNWMHEIRNVCGKETYFDAQPTRYSASKRKKRADEAIRRVYKIVTINKFVRLVLGERKTQKGGGAAHDYSEAVAHGYGLRAGTKVEEYQPMEDGIESINNTLLIVDEAHEMVSSSKYLALQRIVRSSTNLKLLLLTATPMRNQASDIIELMNLLLPEDQPLDVDKMFVNASHVGDRKLLQGGLDYFMERCRGLVSFVRSVDPQLFPKHKDHGKRVPGVDGLPLVECPMTRGSFQLECYKRHILPVIRQDGHMEALNIQSFALAASNFAFPVWGDQLEYTTGTKGLESFRKMWKGGKRASFLKRLKKEHGVSEVELTTRHQLPGGSLLQLNGHLRKCSAKFHAMLTTLIQMGPGPAFVFSNLVQLGVNVVEEVLLANGFVAYEHRNTEQAKKGRCARCGKYAHEGKHEHGFAPSTFVTFRSKAGTVSKGKEDTFGRITVEELSNLLTNPQNLDGSLLKVVIGSQVVSMGVTMRNVRAIHMMDAHLNLSRLKQALGRVIRWCSHAQRVTNEDPQSSVDVYRYCATAPVYKDLSAETRIYAHAAKKYREVVKVEEAMRRMAIDCMLHQQIHGDAPCMTGPDDPLWDPRKKQYRDLEDRELGVETYHLSLEDKEVEDAVSAIQAMFIVRPMYEYRDLLSQIPGDRKAAKLALELLTPTTDTEESSFRHTFRNDKGEFGHLQKIWSKKYQVHYFLFKPWTRPSNEPLVVRMQPTQPQQSSLYLNEFLHMEGLLDEGSSFSDKSKKIRKKTKKAVYDEEWYANKPEGRVVGIIDYDKQGEERFKIRAGTDWTKEEKRRKKGMPTKLGNVCETKPKADLVAFGKELKLDLEDLSRVEACGKLKKRLTQKQSKDAKSVWLRVPKN